MEIGRAVSVGILLCLGTALAMAVSHDAPADAGHSTTSPEQFNAGQPDRTQSDIRFELPAVKRAVPKGFQSSDLLQSKSWYVPPPPPPAAPANILPSEPSAPVLPFTFIGRAIDGNEVTLFLSSNGRHYTVKVNELLDHNYRVDEITNSNAVLTYLPTNTRQTLTFDSTAVGSSALSLAPQNTITLAK